MGGDLRRQDRPGRPGGARLVGGTSGTAVVTGAFSYTGRHIAQSLLGRGYEVRTLTGHPDREDPLRERVPAFRLDFSDPGALRRALGGADVLFNTYWIRFPRGSTTFESAVRNTRTLLEAAAAAGVSRVVHISITNPSEDSPFPYFRGKAEVERDVRTIAPSWGIVRPTVVFGGRDVFVNNIAWLLRRFPFFPMPGSGRYRIQPVHVEDVAHLAVEAGERRDDMAVDAAGPEVFSFEEMVLAIGRAIGRRVPIVRAPPDAALGLSRIVGRLVRDVILTRDELRGLMAELVVSQSAPTGRIAMTEWLGEHGHELGARYASELGRHYR